MGAHFATTWVHEPCLVVNHPWNGSHHGWVNMVLFPFLFFFLNFLNEDRWFQPHLVQGQWKRKELRTKVVGPKSSTVSHMAHHWPFHNMDRPVKCNLQSKNTLEKKMTWWSLHFLSWFGNPFSNASRGICCILLIFLMHCFHAHILLLSKQNCRFYSTFNSKDFFLQLNNTVGAHFF